MSNVEFKETDNKCDVPFKHAHYSVTDVNPQTEKDASGASCTVRDGVCGGGRIREWLEVDANRFQSSDLENMWWFEKWKTYRIAFPRKIRVDPSYIGSSTTLKGKAVTLFSISIPK